MHEFHRSWIFVPGDRQRMLEKSPELAADAVIFDLEDAVASERKALARERVAAAVRTHLLADVSACYVRVNPAASGQLAADLDAVTLDGLDGIVLAKAENADEVMEASMRLGQLESQRGLDRGRIRIVAALESPKSLQRAAGIALAAPRVAALMFGAEDYVRELGLPSGRRRQPGDLGYAREALVVAATAAGLASIDRVWPDISDLDGLAQDAAVGRQFGFTGKALIHPSQVPVANEAFAPSAVDVEYARAAVEAFETAQREGRGAIAFRGQMLDLPIVERARHVLALAERLQPRVEDRR